MCRSQTECVLAQACSFRTVRFRLCLLCRLMGKDGPIWKCLQDGSRFCEVRAQSRSSGQSNRSRFPRGRVVVSQSSADTSRSRFSHVQRTIQDCEVGSRNGCSWGVLQDVSQPLRRSAEDTCIGRGSASSRPHCKHRISLHAPGSECFRDRAQKVW